MQEHTFPKPVLKQDLENALDRNEFEVFYQPVIDMSKGVPAAFEALLRWNRPGQGLLSPDHFLTEANESGLIVPIGEWVLRTACEQVLRWQTEFDDLSDLGVSVNISGEQFAHKDLGDIVGKAISESGIAAECVYLEITENTLMTDVEGAKRTLEKIKALGVQFAIDDFGIGYSSMGQLPRLPVYILKLDRSFVSGMNSINESRRIVETLLNIRTVLKMKAVAEGVETAAQDELLRHFGCEYAQGYFYSHPMSAETAAEWITNRCPRPIPGSFAGEVLTAAAAYMLNIGN